MQTRDPEAAQPFYERVFGYETETAEMGAAGRYVLLAHVCRIAYGVSSASTPAAESAGRHSRRRQLSRS